MDQAACLKIIRLAKKATWMVKLVYEGEDGKPVSTLLYLSKYPDSESANNAVKILKSKDKNPEDFLDKVSVGKGYLLVSLGKLVLPRRASTITAYADCTRTRTALPRRDASAGTASESYRTATWS